MKGNGMLLGLIVIITLIFIIAMIGKYTNEICDKDYDRQVCFKTECNFWGCRKIIVDLDSPQCEVKENLCKSSFD